MGFIGQSEPCAMASSKSKITRNPIGVDPDGGGRVEIAASPTRGVGSVV